MLSVGDADLDLLVYAFLDRTGNVKRKRRLEDLEFALFRIRLNNLG